MTDISAVPEIREHFHQIGIVPDLLPRFEPEGMLEVEFGKLEVPVTDSDNTGLLVRVLEWGELIREQFEMQCCFCGCKHHFTPSPQPQTGLVQSTHIPPALCKRPPSVHCPFALTRPSSLFTLVFVDVDVPSRAARRSLPYLHWVVVNIPGESFDVSKGDTIVEYLPVGTAAKTGEHRYVFLLFEQPAGPLNDVNLQQPHIGTCIPLALIPRQEWNLAQFVDTHHLAGPIAGSMFSSTYDGSGTPVAVTFFTCSCCHIM